MATTKKTLAILAEQTANADGSITIRAIAVADGREIGTGEAAKLLGFSNRESVTRLIDCGQIKAWKPETERGNGKYRISLQSVLDYKTGRIKAGRDGFSNPPPSA